MNNENNNLFNWKLYILNVLDGKYETTIIKKGSSYELILSKLESFEDLEFQRDCLHNALKEIIEKHHFDAIDVVNDKIQNFDYLCSWIFSFLSYDEKMIRKIIGLLVTLSKMDTNVLTQDALNRYKSVTYNNIFSLIITLNKMKEGYANQGMDIKKELSYFKYLINYWKQNSLNADNTITHLSVKALIYFQEWHLLSVAERKKIIFHLDTLDNQNQNALNLLLDDMGSIKLNSILDYNYFADDYKSLTEFKKTYNQINIWTNIPDIDILASNKDILNKLLASYKGEKEISDNIDTSVFANGRS